MAEFAALPIFTDAILADTGHLSDEEFGRYVRLLIVTWRSPDCRIPNDREWIAKRLRLTPLQFEGLILPLLQEFFTSTGNWYIQKRLSKEFEYVRKRRKKQTDAVKSRWEKEKKPNRGNTPSPSPSPSKEDTIVSSMPGGSSPPETQTDAIAEGFQQFWGLYPGRGKDGATGGAYKGSRADALKCYERIMRKEKESDRHQTHAAITTGCHAYAEHLARSGYPSKHASTWLNQQCWKDDYTSSTPSPQLSAGPGASQKPGYGHTVYDAAGAALSEIQAREKGNQ